MQEEMQETEVRETTSLDGDTAVTQQRVSQHEQPSSVVVLQRIIWFIAGFISVIVALRFIFLLLGANQGAAFTDFIYSLSGVFVAPFVGIFGEPVYGTSVFEMSSLLAIIIYLLIAWGLAKLVTIARPKEEI